MGGTLTNILFTTAGPSAGGRRVISMHCWVLREHASVFSRQELTSDHGGHTGRVFLVFGGDEDMVGCVLFENCTVDASIFVVSNEERTVDALAPGADEGRRRLR